MLARLEQIALEEEKAYDCEIITLYGHKEFSGRAVYLGKVFGVKKQLHGMIYRKSSSGPVIDVIKFSDKKVRISEGVVVIKGYNGVYGMSIKERGYWEGLLKERGL